MGGKVYNTETAEAIAGYDNGMGQNDFGQFDETLYKTRNGAWFLHGRGGATSPYGATSGNSRFYGSNLVAMTKEEALEWLEDRNIGDDEAFKHFDTKEA